MTKEQKKKKKSENYDFVLMLCSLFIQVHLSRTKSPH